MAASISPFLLLATILVPHSALSQPFAPGTGFLGLGNLLTSDTGGPYNVAARPDLVREVQGDVMQSMALQLAHTCRK